MQTDTVILVNGGFNNAISALDRGLTYGDGVFRTLKAVGAMPVHWPLHYQKLVEDCSAIGLVCPSADVLMGDLNQLLTPDESPCVIKIIITRGEGGRGYKPSSVVLPTRIVTKSDLPHYPGSYFEEGVDLQVCETRLSQQKKLAGVKHLNRLENVLASMEWAAPAFAEGIMLDKNGHVIECTAANIFARFDDTLVTPRLDQCGVAGVTRMQVLARTEAFELKSKIDHISLEQLLSADEVILTNSLYGALQARSITNKKWGKQTLANTIRKAINHD